MLCRRSRHLGVKADAADLLSPPAVEAHDQHCDAQGCSSRFQMFCRRCWAVPSSCSSDCRAGAVRLQDEGTHSLPAVTRELLLFCRQASVWDQLTAEDPLDATEVSRHALDPVSFEVMPTAAPYQCSSSSPEMKHTAQDHQSSWL